MVTLSPVLIVSVNAISLCSCRQFTGLENHWFGKSLVETHSVEVPRIMWSPNRLK